MWGRTYSRVQIEYNDGIEVSYECTKTQQKIYIEKIYIFFKVGDTMEKYELGAKDLVTDENSQEQ